MVDTRKNEDMDIFRKFMLTQYSKMLNKEIDKVLDSQKARVIRNENKNGFGMSMMF